MLGSTFGSSTKAAHGINSMMIVSVICTVQSLKTTLERMDHSLANPDSYIILFIGLVFWCFNWKE